MSFPEALKSGVVKARTNMTANGTADQSTQGRNLPHRVLVRSAITPMKGSNTASQKRPTSSRVPAAAAVMPKTSV